MDWQPVQSMAAEIGFSNARNLKLDKQRKMDEWFHG